MPLSAVWTKICGLTRPEDARTAEALGADALGVVLYKPSSRAITPERIADVLAETSGGVRKVALFVDPDAEQVEMALATGAIDYLQFHGDEAESFCSSFGVPYMKAIRVRSAAQVLKEIERHQKADRILLDKYIENVPGGTGKTFDWSVAAEVAKASDKPVVLAGGLNAENITAAIETVGPAGVDVSSGVEQAPGIKDSQKLKLFIEGVRSV